MPISPREKALAEAAHEATQAPMNRGLAYLGIPLPASLENWIISHYYEDLVDVLVDAY